MRCRTIGRTRTGNSGCSFLCHRSGKTGVAEHERNQSDDDYYDRCDWKPSNHDAITPTAWYPIMLAFRWYVTRVVHITAVMLICFIKERTLFPVVERIESRVGNWSRRHDGSRACRSRVSDGRSSRHASHRVYSPAARQARRTSVSKPSSTFL
jgi:hypothetical protein